MGSRVLGLLAATAAVTVATSGAAAAHVTLSPHTATAGERVVLRMDVEHGCEGAPTTGLAIEVPEEVGAVEPVASSSWVVGSEHRADGARVVSFVAKTPIPDGSPVGVDLEVTAPGNAGTYVFPTVQTCADTELAWLEVARDGSDGQELELPAPTLVVTGPPERSDGPGAALGIGVLAAGVVGAGLARTLLLRKRR